MIQADHFVIRELVPRHVFSDRGERAWELLDSRAIVTLDMIRQYAGPTTVNNWHVGGDREWSGLRTSQSPYGSEYSQHRYGRAFDCIFSQKSTEEVREYILSHQGEFPFIRGIEMGTSWLHFDVGNRGGEGIFTFYP